MTVPSRAAGWATAAGRQIRVTLASESGVTVSAFALLRLIAALHSPMPFPDTNTYLPLSFVGGASRLWTVPLVWNLFPSNDLREAVQLVFGVVAFATLAITVGGLITGAWLRRIARVTILALGLVPQVTGWDSSLLSESLSTSLLVLLIALLLRVYQRPSRGLTIGCLGVTTLWVFARHVNVLVFVSLLPFVVVFVLRRKPRRPRLWVVVALAGIAAWGMFAITQPRSGGVWKQNALEILENRIAPDPASLAFFYAHGLPASPVILQERAAFPGATSPLFGDPAIRRWLDDNFKTTYLAYLTSRWRQTLTQPFVELPTAVSSQVSSGPARAVLPVPLAQLLWGTEEGDIPFWVAVAAALAVFALASGAPVRFVPVTALLLLASALGAILVWNLTGNPTGVYGGSLGRLFMPVAIMLRIGLLLTIVSSADALRRGGRSQVNDRFPATAPRAGGEASPGANAPVQTGRGTGVDTIAGRGAERSWSRVD